MCPTSAAHCPGRYLLPKGHTEFHRRVAASLGLLIAAKLLNVQVPFLFKYTGGWVGEWACHVRSTSGSQALPGVLRAGLGAERRGLPVRLLCAPRSRQFH